MSSDEGTQWRDFLAAIGGSPRGEFLKLCPFPALLQVPEDFAPASRLAYDADEEQQAEELSARLASWKQGDSDARLLWFLAPPAGQAHATVGRGPVEVRILHASISNKHARFYKRQGFWRVLDLESTGGTRVEGRRVPAGIPLPLASGQVVGLADQRYLFLLPEQLYEFAQASRPAPKSSQSNKRAKIVLPPEGILLLDLFKIVRDVPEAPSEESPPFLLQIPLKGELSDFDEDDSLTQTLSASMVMGLKRGQAENVRVHSVHAHNGGEFAVVGRAAGADLVLPEQTVSKRHARLQISQRGSLRIMDLESQNGTYHQDRKLPVGVYTDVVPGETLRFARYAGLFLSPENLRDLLDHIREHSPQ